MKAIKIKIKRVLYKPRLILKASKKHKDAKTYTRKAKHKHGTR